MNLVRFLLLSLLVFPSSLLAQINWGDYSQSFPDGLMDKPERIGLILTIPKANNSFWTARGTSVHFAAVAKDSLFKKLRPDGVVARTTFDTAKAHFFLQGVTQKNASAYEFRVMQYPGWKVVVDWQSITQFTDSTLNKQSGQPQMAYLGGYKAPLGNMLVVDVRKKGSGPIIATNMVAWESIRPAVASIYTSADVDVFLQKLQYPWARTRSTPTYSTKDLHLPATNTQLIYVLNADIYTKDQVQYQLIHNDQVIRPWQDNQYDNSFIWLNGFAPGHYRIQIRYSVQPQHVTECSYIIAPAWYQSVWFRLAGAGVGIMLLGLFAFGYLLIRQRRKTQQEEANKQKLQLELQALHAQLNPHFVFNALNSIQGLINRQDIKAANDYLSVFARLMRESLANSGKEETPLSQELQTMETYLKLEQLRFGFAYTIEVDPQLEVYSTNIPSLLWQPLLENAVKHGVSALQQAGRIAVRFDKKDSALIIRISDNGKGITTHVTPGGFGLKLTQDRIDLLNKLNPEQPINLSFSNQLPTGTDMTLTFNHWFS